MEGAFIDICREGDVNKVKQWLSNSFLGGDVNNESFKVAVRYNHVEIADLLLQSRKISMNDDLTEYVIIREPTMFHLILKYFTPTCSMLIQACKAEELDVVWQILQIPSFEFTYDVFFTICRMNRPIVTRFVLKYIHKVDQAFIEEIKEAYTGEDIHEREWWHNNDNDDFFDYVHGDSASAAIQFLGFPNCIIPQRVYQNACRMNDVCLVKFFLDYSKSADDWLGYRYACEGDSLNTLVVTIPDEIDVIDLLGNCARHDSIKIITHWLDTNQITPNMLHDHFKTLIYNNSIRTLELYFQLFPKTLVEPSPYIQHIVTKNYFEVFKLLLKHRDHNASYSKTTIDNIIKERYPEQNYDKCLDLAFKNDFVEIEIGYVAFYIDILFPMTMPLSICHLIKYSKNVNSVLMKAIVRSQPQLVEFILNNTDVNPNDYIEILTIDWSISLRVLFTIMSHPRICQNSITKTKQRLKQMIKHSPDHLYYYQTMEQIDAIIESITQMPSNVIQNMLEMKLTCMQLFYVVYYQKYHTKIKLHTYIASKQQEIIELSRGTKRIKI